MEFTYILTFNDVYSIDEHTALIQLPFDENS